MTKFYRHAFLIALLIWPAATMLKAQNLVSTQEGTTLDQIVAVVNDHIILKSEVDERVRQTMFQMQRNQQQVSFNKQMWYNTLQGMVEEYVMLDQAAVDSVSVSESSVDQRIEARIDQIVEQVGSREALEKEMGKGVLEIKTDLREQYRKTMTIQEYRRQKMENINITRPEVKSFFEAVPEDSLPTVPEQVAISQIVAIPPANKDARQEAFDLAKALRDSIINHGKSIEELAKRYSDAPRGDMGGEIPLISMDKLVPEYSAAAAALEPGGISKVVESSFGFHVIRLNKRQGNKIGTNHILIEIKEDGYDDEKAINKLKTIRDSVLHEGLPFPEAARKKSEDPNTAPYGGKIQHPQSGARLFTLEQLDPALYRIVLLLDEGEISEPKPFTVGTEGNAQRAFRIVRIDKHVPSHTLSLEEDYDRIKQMALQNKRMKLMRKWIDKLKETVYIDYRIPMPNAMAELNS